MKRTLVLVAVLFLIGTLAAWAEGPTAAPAAMTAPAGGHCVLPDLAGMSPDQIAVAALRAGLTMSPADTPIASTLQACPTTFECSSIAGCGSSMVCAVGSIGKCCVAGPIVLCCSNQIFVERCPCKCVLEDCPSQCSRSTQITWSCS
jgi:hypothetical protein